jgi:hypothetical protein
MNTTHPHPPLASRVCFLGDIENLVGLPEGPSGENVQAVASTVSQMFDKCQVFSVLACAHRNAPAVCFNWPKARYLIRSGPDGADNCLLEVMMNEDLASRFDVVVIGSGDHIFTEAAAELAASGVYVVAAVGRGGLSRHLQLAVHETVYLPIDWIGEGNETAMEVLLSA